MFSIFSFQPIPEVEQNQISEEMAAALAALESSALEDGYG